MLNLNKLLAAVTAACIPFMMPIEAHGEDMIIATYSVGSKIKTESDIVAKELENYDFIYLMAAPAWEASDFDGSQQEINRKYVTEHTYPSDVIEKYIATVHQTGGKILCSFPGQEFIDIASSVDRRKKFAMMMAEFVKKYDYDGIELDWEHTIDEELHLRFMQDIRHALTNHGNPSKRYWLTTALHHYRKYTQEQASQLCACIDWINIMYYDMGGGIWGKAATHNSPLDVMKKSIVTDWKYFPHDKLHIGLASYGFYYKGIMPGQQVAEGKNLGDYGRYCNYTELPALLENGWQEQWDDTAQCAYFFAPDKSQFMTLETQRSMDAKLEWIEENRFGGVFWWEYSCDWVKPTKGQDRGKHLITDYVTSKIRE